MSLNAESLKDLAKEVKLAYVHIPKAGGNTFRSILENQPSVEHTKFLNNPEIAEEFFKLPPMSVMRYDLITGHFKYKPRLAKRFRYFSLLRDPLERIISLYSNLMNPATKTNISIAKSMQEQQWSIFDFATSEESEARAFAHPYLFFLAGGVKPSEIESGKVHVTSVFRRAMENLITNFEFVGILERFDEGLVYLRERYGMKIDYEIRNPTPPDVKQSFSQADKERLRELLTPEYELYNMANEILDAKLETVYDLGRKVKEFRESLQ